MPSPGRLAALGYLANGPVIEGLIEIEKSDHSNTV